MLHRGRRPGRARGDRLPAGGQHGRRELRLEDDGGHGLHREHGQLPGRRAGLRLVSADAADPRVRPRRRPVLGDRRLRVPRTADPGPERTLRLRRLLLRRDLGGVPHRRHLDRGIPAHPGRRPHDVRRGPRGRALCRHPGGESLPHRPRGTDDSGHRLDHAAAGIRAGIRQRHDRGFRLRRRRAGALRRYAGARRHRGLVDRAPRPDAAGRCRRRRRHRDESRGSPGGCVGGLRLRRDASRHRAPGRDARDHPP